MSEGDAPKRGDGDKNDAEKFVETQYQVSPSASPSQSNLNAVKKNADPLIGTTVSGYVVKGKLGSGGMGIVYEGEQPVIGKRVAIKVLRPEIAENPEQVKRLVEEARAVNTVGHRGIIDVFGFGEVSDGRQCIVMEYLDGEALMDLLTRNQKEHRAMPIAEVMVVLEEILSALGAAHGAGVVHRDMKPSNIFLCRQRDGTRFVKILDFGIAKLGVHGTTPQTQASMLVGTPSYMAPEQARGGGISPAMDLYAVGVIAFEMITGQLPFMGNSVVEVLMKHAEEPPVKPSSLLMSIPDDVDDLILKLLAKKPADRYPSAESVRVDVVRIRKALADSTARRTELDVELDKRLKKQLQTMVLPDLASSIDLSGGEDATMPPSVRPDMRPRQPQQFATSEDVTLPPDSRPHLRPQNPPSVISPLAADTRAVPQLPPPPPHDMTGFPIPARGRAPAPEEDEATIPPQLPPEEVDKSKLPLLLVLGFVAVLAVGVAWFFLHERPPDVVDLTPPVKPLPPERPRPPSKPVEAKDLMPGAEPTTPEPVKPPEPAPPDSARDERHAEPVKPEPTVAKPPEPIVAKPPEPVKPEPAVVKQAPPRPAPAPAPAGRSKKDQLIERFGRLETNMAQRPDKETELKAVRKFLEKLKAGSVPNDQLPNVEAAASRFEDGLK